MRRRLTEPDQQGPIGEAREQRNRNALVAFLLVCSAILFLVSGLPSVLVAPALGQLLALVSFGAAVLALLRREGLLADRVTHWDQAAAFLALSLLASMLTDTAAVTEFLGELSAETPPAAKMATRREGGS